MLFSQWLSLPQPVNDINQEHLSSLETEICPRAENEYGIPVPPNVLQGQI
jgi:hypothetical protein